MRPLRLLLAAVAAQLALTGVTAGPAGHAAVAADTGAPGYCKGSAGVTVVVDFSALGGDIVVRCAGGPTGPGFSGLDALQQAGFGPEGTRRDGLSFVCRIAGRPAADEPLPVEGDEGYTEDCADTPPADAHWSYWHARNGGRWVLSSTGAANRDALAGGFEGWAFSLNESSGDRSRPGVAPVRPDTGERDRPASPSPTPRATADGSASMDASGDARGGAGSKKGAKAGQEQRPGPRASMPAPGATPETAGRTGSPKHRPGSRARKRHEGDLAESAAPVPVKPSPSVPGDEVVVTGDLAASREPPATGGSSSGVVLGLGVMALLAAGGGAVAWRRTRRS